VYIKININGLGLASLLARRRG